MRGQEAASSSPIIGMPQQGVHARAPTGIGETGRGEWFFRWAPCFICLTHSLLSITPDLLTCESDFKQSPNTDIPSEIMSGLKWWENKTVPAAVHNYLFVSKLIRPCFPYSTSDS